jgi:NitT/TauT family transport system substrate-binding protein
MRKSRVVASATVALTLATAALVGVAVNASAQSSRPALAKVTMGIEPWIGYAPWYIAQKKGFFKACGVDVSIINFQTDADRNAALIAGKTNVSNIDTGRTIQFVELQKAPIKLLAIEDASVGADAVLASKTITSPKQVAGQSVAYESGTTSDLLLHYMLRKFGIPFSKIKQVSAPAASAGTLLIAGKVPVAVTYEPYISNATSHGSHGAHVLFSSKNAPGLISDFLVTTQGWLGSHSAEAKALMCSWNKATAYYVSNRKDAVAIMAAGVGSKVADLAPTLAGVTIYTIPANKRLLKSGELAKEYLGIGQTLKAQGVVKATVPFSKVANFSYQP